MKSVLVLLAVLALLGAATVALAQPSAPAQPAHVSLFGSIKSVRHTPQGYELRLDPGWWLTGHAAEQASFEATGSRDVPNDSYVVEEGHRLLSFLIARS